MKGTKWENLGFFDKGQASVTEFIRYPNEQDDEARVDISQDVAVAIPGGVIGQHAFYTILENVLRNAAKHEWSQFEIACRRHLNLYVDFVDQPEKGSVVCRVWTECVLTEVDGGTRHQGANDDLLKHMNEKIALSFVNASGELRKENWGIAEMRISAGYLRGCDIADVGGTGSLQIIHPVLVDTNDKRKGLGYCFKINKPKELLVVLKEETVREIDETSASGGVRNVFGINLAKANADALPCGKDEAARKIDETPTLGGVRNDFGTNLDKANAKALQYGVEFKAASKVKNAEANAYSYMLFEDSDHDQIAELLACVPFRTLTQKNGYGGEFFTAGDLVERFRKIGESEEYARATCLQLLEDVYAGWLKHISGVRYGEKAKKLQLAIDIEGEASSPGGRQSLVSDCDLIRFVFEHSFNAAIRSFLSDAKNGAGISNECMALLYAVAGMRQRQVASFKELVANGRNKSGGSVTEDEVNTELKTEHGVAQVVLWQLEKWFVEILKGSGELNLKKMLSEDDLKRHESLKDKEVLKIGTLEEFYGRAGNYVTVERFTMFIESTILKQAESFLRKYEEDISTMPQGFSPKPDRGTEPTSCKWEKAGVSIGFVNDDIKRAKCKRDGAFCYFRHGEQTFKMYTTGYYEALSGAQSGLNALDSYRRDVKYVDDATSSSSADDLDVKLAKNNAARFTARLAENAIVRLLIIDERVKKFMDDHDNVKRMLPGLGIAVLDHTSQTTKEMFPKGEDAKWGAISGVKIDDIEKTGDKKPLPMTLSDFEVVIIHQGVIDKLLDGHDSKEAVRKWLAEMNDNLAGHYIVITTGRGSPANIPENARVLPYSVIESSILQRYPEKMILVDTLMNLLPTLRRSK